MSIEGQMNRLEKQLDDCDDPEERRYIEEELREMDRELRDRERWQEEGQERGWW